MTRGLKGSEISKLPDMTQEHLHAHIEKEHHIAVQREGETREQCMERFYRENPEARDRTTCKCPECSQVRALR